MSIKSRQNGWDFCYKNSDQIEFEFWEIFNINTICLQTLSCLESYTLQAFTSIITISKPRVKLFNCYAKSIARGHAFAGKDTSRFRWLWYKDKERDVVSEEDITINILIVVKKKFCKLDRTFLHARGASECACKSRKCSLRSAITGNVRLCILRWSQSTSTMAIIFRIERRNKNFTAENSTWRE